MPMTKEAASRALGGMMSGTSISLHSADPGDVGVNELSGGGYRRRLADLEETDEGWSNSGVLAFPMLPAGIVTHVALWGSDGDLLWTAELESPKQFNVHDTLVLEAGALEFGITVR